MAIDTPRTTERWFFAAVLAASLLALSIAMTAQYVFGIEPCVLCRYQRIPYWTVVALAVAATVVPMIDRAGVAAVIAVAFAAGAAVAFYHVGVEQHWWHAATACAAQGGMPASFEAFRTGPLAPVAKPCDAIDWTLFGFSMTVYNATASAALSAAAIFASLQMRK